MEQNRDVNEGNGTAIKSLRPPKGKKPAGEGSGDLKLITIPPLRVGVAMATLSGLTQFISHAWSDDAITKIQKSQGQDAPTPRAKRNPEKEFRDSMYFLDDDKTIPAVKAVMIKQAIEAAGSVVNVEPWVIRPRLFVYGIEHPDFIRIEDSVPKMRTDMRRQSGIGRVSSPVYRAAFDVPWRLKVRIEYIRNAISPEQITSLLQYAGWCIGIGDYRPQKKGGATYGRFEVEQVAFAQVD